LTTKTHKKVKSVRVLQELTGADVAQLREQGKPVPTHIIGLRKGSVVRMSQPDIELAQDYVELAGAEPRRSTLDPAGPGRRGRPRRT